MEWTDGVCAQTNRLFRQQIYVFLFFFTGITECMCVHARACVSSYLMSMITDTNRNRSQMFLVLKLNSFDFLLAFPQIRASSWHIQATPNHEQLLSYVCMLANAYIIIKSRVIFLLLAANGSYGESISDADTNWTHMIIIHFDPNVTNGCRVCSWLHLSKCQH